MVRTKQVSKKKIPLKVPRKNIASKAAARKTVYFLRIN